MICVHTPQAQEQRNVEETDADGNVTTVTKSVLYVNVTLKSYRDMISVYGFNSDQVEMLEQIMSPELWDSLDMPEAEVAAEAEVRE